MYSKIKPYALVFLFFLVSRSSIFSQLQSPQQFLGYGIGERFTPSHELYRYAEHVAQEQPNKVKIVNYGQTYENRRLMMVVMSSEENIKNLEQNRTDHLKSIGMMAGSPVTKTRPPFVWLSYNVHGNEGVSSEAFLKVLYELLQNNPLSEKILKNNVVILAPCLNPDGHDRYVNWYNQKLGTSPNANADAWEHAEPWPGGRYTHYLFDPNRDWAWQTQEITKQLIAEYHRWMPQVHGDFHEMGPNSPYYFAPAAKPYHEDITTWQRELQDIIGNYNRKYFDKNNWLYYTRERFDLLYPSYGDTWPTYNGAIGMTYEQGGGGIAGLAYERPSEGDTLTLKNRIAHSAGASIATLEAIADRPAKVVDEFVKFYEKSQSNPIGTFKGYVIKTSGDEGKVKALRELLDKNKIQYAYATDSKPLTGYNYLTQKEENFKSEANDLVISTYQPKSMLLKILFETKPMLEDSVTYDITSWCVPLAYGLRCYGVKDKIAINSNSQFSTTNNQFQTTKPYAYLVSWKSAEDAKFLAAILKNKIKVRSAEKAFEMDSKSHAAGTLVITRAGNENFGERFDKIIRDEATKFGVSITATEGGGVSKGSDFGSDFVNILKTPRVGMLAGDGFSMTATGEVWHFFDQEINYPVTVIDPSASRGGGIPFSKLDALIVPSTFGSPLREAQLTALKDWVRGGGRLILLENATGLASDKEGFGLKTKKSEKADKKIDSLKVYANRERESVMDDTPGSIYKIKLDNTHPLAFGMPDHYFALVNNVYDYEFLKDGWNVGYLKKEKESYVAGFVGKNLKEKLQNSLFFGTENFGRGQVVYMANDPLFRGFWNSGKLIFANAVFMMP